MRTLSQTEIEQVSGGVDSFSFGGVSITGIEAGLVLRNVIGAGGVAYGLGYAVGSGFNSGWQGISGDSLGTDIYQTTNS